MLDACLILSQLHIDLLAMATRSMNDTWEVLAPGFLWSGERSTRENLDLMVLGLDRMPQTTGALRQAYRLAARAAHPDAGGTAGAFRAVSEAFGRLSERNARLA